MAIRARYRYILEVFTPRDGGWVRWFNCFESAEDAEQGRLGHLRDGVD